MTTDFSRPGVVLGFFAFSLAFSYQYFISPPPERPLFIVPGLTLEGKQEHSTYMSPKKQYVEYLVSTPKNLLVRT